LKRELICLENSSRGTYRKSLKMQGPTISKRQSIISMQINLKQW